MTVFQFSIPTPLQLVNLELNCGTSLLFVGANGSGKSRLATYIENKLGLEAHRISAHRALSLNPDVPKINEELAYLGLRTGYASRDSGVQYRQGNRWGQKSSHLLNDYDQLLQTLFAEQSNKSLETHKRVCAGDTSSPEETKFQKLQKIWERLLPTRSLNITGDDIKVFVKDNSTYNASEMSDGERAIFYLIGQTLCAAKNSVIIFDEPELHIHRSIMSSLWDELESARPDCGFIFISHDLEFVASRVGQKHIIRDYAYINGTPTWSIEAVPEDTGFSEALTTEILGSRRPVLFVEGSITSLDKAIYRSCYPEWHVIPIGSCEDVIHSVNTMNKNPTLNRITCAGIIDADDYTESEIEYLNKIRVKVLHVSEVENLFLLPDIVTSIAKQEGYDKNEINQILNLLTDKVLENIAHDNNLNDCINRYCRRRIDRTLKRIDFSDASTVDEISNKYTEETQSLNIQSLANERKQVIERNIQDRNLVQLMALYNNKSLFSLSAQHLRSNKVDAFKNWLVRNLNNNSIPEITEAFKRNLPEIEIT